jgi:hypothetical protein
VRKIVTRTQDTLGGGDDPQITQMTQMMKGSQEPGYARFQRAGLPTKGTLEACVPRSARQICDISDICGSSLLWRLILSRAVKAAAAVTAAVNFRLSLVDF